MAKYKKKRQRIRAKGMEKKKRKLRPNASAEGLDYVQTHGPINFFFLFLFSSVTGPNMDYMSMRIAHILAQYTEEKTKTLFFLSILRLAHKSFPSLRSTTWASHRNRRN